MKMTSGFTLMELLLVVAILAILAGVILPPVLASQREQADGVATLQVLNAVEQARSLGLLGRRTEATLTFTSGSRQMVRGNQVFTLPPGYSIGTTAEFTFDLQANVSCNGTANTGGTINLRRPDGRSRAVIIKTQGMAPEVTPWN